MLLIPAPGAARATRPSSTTAAQAHVAYPEDPAALSDEEWAEYLFFRDNPKGLFAERWSPQRRLPPVVQRRPRHRDLPSPRVCYRIDRAEADDPMNAPFRTAGLGGPIDRDAVPRLHLRRPGLHRAPPVTPWPPRCWPTACTRSRPASGWAARAASSPPGARSRTRWSRSRRPFPEPMLPATTVELYDGLVARGLAGQGRLAESPTPARYDADPRALPTCWSSAPARPAWPPP